MHLIHLVWIRTGLNINGDILTDSVGNYDINWLSGSSFIISEVTIHLTENLTD